MRTKTRKRVSGALLICGGLFGLAAGLTLGRWSIDCGRLGAVLGYDGELRFEFGRRLIPGGGTSGGGAFFGYRTHPYGVQFFGKANGTVMELGCVPLGIAAALLVAAGFVVRRTPRPRVGVCRKCGYELAGLPVGASHCPECGADLTGVERTLMPARTVV